MKSQGSLSLSCEWFKTKFASKYRFVGNCEQIQIKFNDLFKKVLYIQNKMRILNNYANYSSFSEVFFLISLL
jgi:hypothetical protein